MQQYLDLLKDIRDNGIDCENRTGVDTRAVFGRQLRFDLSEGFPLLTTKKLYLRGIIHELLWFLKGDTNIQYLLDNDVHIWDEWAATEDVSHIERLDRVRRLMRVRENHPEKFKHIGEVIRAHSQVPEEEEGAWFIQHGAPAVEEVFTKRKGDLGPVYGKQWRSWEGRNGKTIDQIAWVIDRIRSNPDCRRLIVMAWQPAELDEMALAPCHCLFQFRVLNGKLHCQLYQRSADSFLGVPFNIASYALLTMMIAAQCDLEPGEFVHTFGDAHIYHNHLEQVEEQLSRTPRPLPKMWIRPFVESIFDYKFEDFELVDYDPYPAIKAEVAV